MLDPTEQASNLNCDVSSGSSGPGHEQSRKIEPQLDPVAPPKLDLDFGRAQARVESHERGVTKVHLEHAGGLTKVLMHKNNYGS